jgi:hypothetical protein
MPLSSLGKSLLGVNERRLLDVAAIINCRIEALINGEII